jgi:hypothetical protein
VIRPGERPAELIDLQGAWRRDGRAFSDGTMQEVADVLWLQVGRFFCDLRTLQPTTASSHALDQPQAFSGSVKIEGGAISFHHDLDSLPRHPLNPDKGTVHRKDDLMFERGPGFEEIWRASSLPGDDTGVAELHPSDGGDGPPMARLLRIGWVALAVWGGDSPGGAQFATTSGWLRERHLYEPDATMAIDAAAFSMGQGDPLPENWVTLDPGEV